ncbi:hypothetical protein TOPH_04912 [Tolypocladium ophioglossoides CBS 100239]|uniref:Uncharacterized protein n=1 Tax=Tolypocladium ophioglossoides (strain CBS 100239) TaxID=1163406 RepID=A0A0L0N8H3_TOLOC|nr:hypothetical protein TOPH_04912 [Tolypocladium ophioglossoides CBS 100239]
MGTRRGNKRQHSSPRSDALTRAYPGLYGQPSTPFGARNQAQSTKHKAQAHRFSESLAPMLVIFERAPIPSSHLEPPMSLLISCLAALFSPEEFLIAVGKPWPPFNEDKLVKILDLAIQAYQHEDLEPRITPLASLLFYIAREAWAETKQRAGPRRLATAQAGENQHRGGDTGAQTTLGSPILRAIGWRCKASDLQCGFGCGVGPLSMSVPPDDIGNSEIIGGPSEINPITGQYRDMESQPSLPEMAMEEREREAERLFVLFNRLRATGVADVETLYMPRQGRAGSRSWTATQMMTEGERGV